MGAPNNLDLCLPGRVRDNLLKALRNRQRRKKNIPAAAPPIRRSLSFSSRNASIASVGSRVKEPSAFEKLMEDAGVEEYDDRLGGVAHAWARVFWGGTRMTVVHTYTRI